MKLQDRAALVTGASKGIGRAIALAFADEGAHVGITGRALDELESLREEIMARGVRCALLPADLAEPGAVDRVHGHVVQELGPVRTLVNDLRIAYDARRLGKTVEELEVTLTPLGRRLEPEEVAPLAVYLASDDARAMTGQTINIDGGVLMTG